MASADDVLAIAAGEVGYSRWDDPQTGTKYGRWFADITGESYYGTSGVPYCAMFVSWVFAHAGASCTGLPGAYCPTMLAAGNKVNPSSAQPGDVVYYDWNGDGESDHVGIVVANHESYLETIEGNTSVGSGSQTNGGVVARRQRAWDYVCGVVRPDWSDGMLTSTTGLLIVDGLIGKNTVSKWQKQLCLTVTGVVSGQLEECRKSYPALTSVSFDGSGCELMRVVQTLLGVPSPTGVIASGTVAHLQGRLYLLGHSCAADRAGVLDTATAKALQESLNAEEWAA